MKSIIKQYKIILPTLIIGLILGWLLFPGGGQKDRLQNAADHEHLDEGGLWTCSMHPQIQQDKPGLCPICAMDLIPLEVTGSQEEGVDPMEVSMTSSAIKLAEIQTYRVGQTDMNKTLYLQGKVTFDERRVSEVTARFGGRIESLHVSFTGQEVQRGQKLASIYSPDILTAQKELQEAARLKESMPALYQAARNKLQLWSLSEEQINMIESAEKASTSFDILSPISGVVTMRHVAKGDYVKEGQQLFMIVDLKQLWIQFDAYESDLPWIKIGSMLTYRINGLPDLDFKAQVEFIDPIINAKTRVAQVRIGVDNHKGLLKPEMFVSGKLIASNTQKNVLIIPKSAVLWTGKRSLVYVQVEDRESPSFMMREITLGTDAGAFYEVLDGLKPDELVVSNGVFKIDAAAQLRGLRSMMNPSMGKAILAHDHGNMTTDANRVESQESSQ